MYNKNQFEKINDKRVLHKIKKHWTVISVALLGLLGGGAVTTTHASANANTDNKSNNNQVHQQVNTNQLQSNQSKLVSNNTQSNINTQSNANSSNISQNDITKEANQLHSKILMGTWNQANSLASQKLGNNYSAEPASEISPTPTSSTIDTNTSPQTAKTVKVGKWNNINVNYWSDDTMELSGNGFINAINVPNLPFNSDKNNWKLRINPDSHIYLNESNQAFSGNLFPLWKHFKSMDLSGLDTRNVTSMHGMFQGDSLLQYLNLSRWNTNNVSDMSNMFQSDSSLPTLDLSSFNTNNVTNMSDMFAGNNMNNLNLSNFNTKNVSDMNNMGIINVSDITLGNKTNLSKYFKTLDDMIPCYMNYSDNNLTSKVLSGSQSAGNYVTALAFVVRLLPSNSSTKGIYTNKKVLIPAKFDVSQNVYEPQFNYYLSPSDIKNAGIDLSGYNLNSSQNGYISVLGNTGVDDISISPSSFININSLHFINSKNKYVGTYNNIPLHIPANKYAINDTLNKLNLPKGYQLDQADNQNYTVQTSNGKNYLNVRLIPIYKNVDIHLVEQHGTSLGDYISVKVPADNKVFNEYHNDVVNEIEHSIPYSLIGNNAQNCTLQPGNYLNVSVMVPDSATPNHSSSAMIRPNKASSASTSSAKSSSTTSSVSSHMSVSSASTSSSSMSTPISSEASKRVPSSVAPSSSISQHANSNPTANKSSKSQSHIKPNVPQSTGNTSSSDMPKSDKIIKTGKWDNINVNYWSNDTMELTGNGTITDNNIPSLPFNFDKNDWTLRIDGKDANVNLSNNANMVFNSQPIFSHFKSMDLTGVHTSDVTNMSGMFSGLDNLQTLDISSFNTSNATNMNNMFNGDPKLQNININPNIFNTSKVTDMSDMFQWDSDLQNIDTSKFVTNNVRDFNSMFNDDQSIKYLDLSNFDTHNASDMQHMFNSTNNLTEVTLGSKTNLNRNQAWNDSYNEPFFDNNVNSDNQNTTLAIKNGTAPAGNYYLYGHAPEINNHNAYTNTYDGLTYKYDPSNKSLEFTNGQLTWNGNSSNSFIGTNDNAPSDINKATTIIFDSSANVGNVTNMSNMFANNSNVQSIILHSFNTTNVKNMSNMFKNDTSLKNLILSKYFSTINSYNQYTTPSSVIKMSDMFANDNALQKVNIQSYLTYFNQSAKLIPLYKVLNDRKHTELINSNLINTKNSYLQSNIGQYLTSPKAIKGIYDGLNYEYDPVNRYLEFTSGSLTWNGNPSNDAFIGASSHTPNNLRNAQSIKFDKGIDMSHVTDMHNMFNDNHSIHSLDLSDLDTSRVTNMNGMFQNDPNLTSLNTNGWNTSNVNNMGWMFYNDKDLSDLDLNSFDTHNVTNMDDMFNIGRSASNNHSLVLNISNFDTRNVKSMNNLFSNSNNGYFPSRITIGTNTKFLNNALHFSNWTTNETNLSNIYPNMSSDTRTIGYDEFLYNTNGNNETNELYNNTLTNGTYYLVKPSPISLIVKHGHNQYSTFKTNGIFTSSDSSYNADVIKSQIKEALRNSNVLNKDYTINPSFNYIMTPNYNRWPNYWSNNIAVLAKENYTKDIQDTNIAVKSDLNKALQFINNSNQQDTQWYDSLNDDYIEAQHMLSEPITWPIANDTNSIEDDANSNLSNIIGANRSDINSDYNNVAGKYGYINDINRVLTDKNVKADPSVTSGINNDKNIIKQASDLIKNDYANPIVSNINNASYESLQASDAMRDAYNLEDQSQQYASNKAHPQVPNIPSGSSSNIQSALNSFLDSMNSSISNSVSAMEASYSSEVANDNTEINLLNSEMSSRSTNPETSTVTNDASLQFSYNSYVNSTNAEINSLSNKINASTPTNDTSEVDSLNNKINSMKQNIPTVPNYSSLQSSYSNYVSDTNAEISSLNSKINDMPQNTNAPTNNDSAMSAYVNNTNNEINSLTNHINSMPQSNPAPTDNNDSALQAPYNSYVNSTNAEINSLATQIGNSATNSNYSSTDQSEATSATSSSILELNDLSVGQDVKYKNGVVARSSMHYNLITINKDCLLHNHLSSVGQVTDYAGVLKRGTTVKIIKAFSFNVNGHKYYRYEINLDGNNYYVTANPTFTINTYIMPTEIKNHRRAVINKSCFMYLHGHKHLLRHGSLIRIKRVIHHGKVTRLQLTNGAIITANKKFVKLI